MQQATVVKSEASTQKNAALGGSELSLSRQRSTTCVRERDNVELQACFWFLLLAVPKLDSVSRF